MGILLISMMAMMTSCVQGDLYELNIVNALFATIVYCYDGCYFYLNNIDYVVKTSLLAN